jgi:hypothetical protein
MRILTKIVIGVVTVVVILLAVGIALSWAPDQPVSVLAARWAPPPSKFTEIAEMQVHLRDEGPANDPVPIMLIHGIAANMHSDRLIPVGGTGSRGRGQGACP